MATPKTALITGITGQDGAYLAQFLLGKGYVVHGMKRHSSVFTEERLKILSPDLRRNFHMHVGDMTDMGSLLNIVQRVRPSELYNLASQSHVHVSFDCPEYTANVNGLGALRLLEAIRLSGLREETRFYQASTSELYGQVREVPQNENTPHHPRSPYAAAKLYAHWITINYRESYDLFASTGTLFNHDSPLRGEHFATRKITRGAAAIKLGLKERLRLGSLDSKRDWGHVTDYVEGMWRILQHSVPDDFVLATGEVRSIRDFATAAFDAASIPLEWQGSGLDEVAVRAGTSQVLIEIDPRNVPPAEVDLLVGDSRKAREVLGWHPRIHFKDVVAEMVAADLIAVAAEAKGGRDV